MNTSAVSLQNTLSRHIRLLDILQTYGPLDVPPTTEVDNRGGKSEAIQREALKAIALLLVVEPEDHVVVTQVKGPRLVIAKARPISEQDRVRASGVLQIVLEIRSQDSTKAEGVLSAIMKQEFGHALLQQRVKHLQESMSQPDTRLASAVKSLYPDSPIEAQHFSESVAKFIIRATGLSSAKTWNLADCEEVIMLARALVRHKFVQEDPGDSPLYSMLKPLRGFVRWTEHFTSLIKYMKMRDMDMLDYRFVLVTATSAPTTVKWDLLNIMEKIIDALRLGEEYDEAKIHLKKIYTKVQDDEMASQYTCALHPEMQIALDQETCGTSTHGTHLIVGNVDPCLCCVLWIRLHNKHFKQALWSCGDNYHDIGTDWAAPDRGGALIPRINEELLAAIKNLLSTFVHKQLKVIEYHSGLELEQNTDDEEGQTEEDDKSSPLD